MISIIDSHTSGAEGEAAWYAVRSHPKHEHIAAANMAQRVPGVEVFNPRIRVRRKARHATRKGEMWSTESLFPNYLFARFDLRTALNDVRHVPGVQTVVSFGGRIPSIPSATINDLREEFGGSEMRVVDSRFDSGDEVTFSSGPFQGLRAVVVRTLNSQERVQVLLEFMNRTISIGADRSELEIDDRVHA